MPLSDPNRAAFVTNEYRVTIAKSDTVHARNPTADDLTIDTQIDASSAAALAANYLTENANPSVYQFEIAGMFTPADFVDGPPAFILKAPRYATDGRTLKVFSVAVNEAAGTSLVQVRG